MPSVEGHLRPTRLLVLLNPGSTSRNYLIGIARAAESMGILAGVMELEPIWRQAAAAGADVAKVRAGAARQVAAHCAECRATHVLGYTHNGVFDFGLFTDPAGGATPVGLFPSLGLTHILVWTDHPHWAAQGSALEPQVARILAHPAHLHVVKAPCAAAELVTLCGWAHVIATTVGEDYDALAPAASSPPLHDVVLIQSDAQALSEPSMRFLAEDDPDPRDMLEAHRQPTLRAVSDVLGTADPVAGASLGAAVQAFAGALIDAKLDHPLCPWWRLTTPLRATHPDATAWLHADMRRWVRFTAAMNTLVGWRRRFWPAWLARHVNVGLYGSASEAMGLVTPPDGARWVDYIRQPTIYARGRVALNINAGHDEEGLTHKPFQIAAASVPCLHHDTIGLADAFDLGREALTFTRGPELLGAVRDLIRDDARRQRLADAMRTRARADHTWGRFLVRVLAEGVTRAPARHAVESQA